MEVNAPDRGLHRVRTAGAEPADDPGEDVTGFLDRAPSHAEITAGGRRQGDHGFFVEPTVVAGLRQDDEMIQREVFGPVITVQRFTD